jgi:hypothetical protein
VFFTESSSSEFPNTVSAHRQLNEQLHQLKSLHCPGSTNSKHILGMDPNTAVKIRGCFIGIPGRREAQPLPKGDMHLAKVVADLHFVASEWWSSRARPQISNSDRSVWGMLDVRQSRREMLLAAAAALPAGGHGVACCCPTLTGAEHPHALIPR